MQSAWLSGQLVQALEIINMDLIQSKLNVIHWLTDYKGKVIQVNGRKFVELTHRKGFNMWLFGCQSIDELLTKLDNFIDRKISPNIGDNSGEKPSEYMRRTG